MASLRDTKSLLLGFIFIELLCLLLSPTCILSSNSHEKGCSFDSMYYFGNGDPATSDGLLMVDHLASASGLRPPSQFVNQATTFIYDVTTAMNTSFFFHNGISLTTETSHSLEAQLDSFNTSLNSICSSPEDCAEKFERALFVIDQVGSEDYKEAFLHGKSLQEAYEYVPQMVQSIKNSIEKLIKSGAKNIMVTGTLPLGCLPGNLTLFNQEDPKQYQYSHNFLKPLNTFAMLHNDHLRMALLHLVKPFPDVRIAYADAYKAFMSVLSNHEILGFKKQSLMKACCGDGGPYNYDPTRMCGKQGLPVCSDPSTYLHWDGFHLTQEAMKLLVDAFHQQENATCFLKSPLD